MISPWGLLESLEPATKPGWDGDDAEPLQGRTLLRALNFLYALPDFIAPPVATPIVDGSLGLFWDNRVYLDVHILTDGSIVFNYVLPTEDRQNANGTIRPEDDMALLVDALRPTFGYIQQSEGFVLTGTLSGERSFLVEPGRAIGSAA